MHPAFDTDSNASQEIETYMSERVKITSNFYLDEFECPCCQENKINRFLVKYIQRVRDAFGKPLFISSGYRCPKHNKKVGGKLTSDHLLGLAADIACYDAFQRRELVYIALSVGIPTIGIKKDCLHFSIGDPARIFTYD